jgi:Rps23 Pro-64 3,4-dihydroxylase Tpa1-like proline 4-hydroxylase
MDKIINTIHDIEILKDIFNNENQIKISNFLNGEFAEKLFQYVLVEKKWILATGIDSIKYEKETTPVFTKINTLQIKNVNDSFGNNKFTYIFYRSMNNKHMSYFEFTLRNILNSSDFITLLNEITNLKLTHLTTLFLSKYKSGSFLSPHSDAGNGTLAFVINITKFWKPQYGGILHFMNENRTEIIRSYVPEFNSFVIFKVPENGGIPHYVSHVSPNVKYSRYAITGWFS